MVSLVSGLWSLVCHQDLFESKIQKNPLKHYFPEYTGVERDPRAAMEFLKEKFLRLNKSEQKKIYTHYTCATDTNSIEKVFNTVRCVGLGAFPVLEAWPCVHRRLAFCRASEYTPRRAWRATVHRHTPYPGVGLCGTAAGVAFDMPINTHELLVRLFPVQ